MTKSRINLLGKTTAGSSRLFSLTGARLFLQKQLWIWPLLAAFMLSAVGYFLRRAVHESLQESVANQLKVVLDADVAALTEWFHTQESTAKACARDNDVVAAAKSAVAMAESTPLAVALIQSPQMQALHEALAPWMELGDYEDYVLVSANKRIVGSKREELIGKDAIGDYAQIVEQALRGQATVSRPFRSIVMLKDGKGVERAGIPTMFVCAPIHNRNSKEPLAVIGFRLRPEGEFSSVLQLARLGKSGETYAIDAHGLMLSQSRFDAQLKTLGLLADTDDASSALTVELRNPGVDMTKGRRPTVPRKEQPLALPAAELQKKQSGVNTVGYLDYRGVPSVGAWTWLDKYQMGIVTEEDYSEAMAPRHILDVAFWSVFGLLAAMSLAIFGFSFVLARMQQRLQKEALKQQKLGQYQLEEKLGEGGMGVVYRGRHALLRRPTAIKLLDIQKTNEASIARFEREVQLTSQLNHPNTIAIYDYGRTPEGIFYYAMEYLDGLDLDRLVQQTGPLPEARVIHILRQVCGSLSEAHRMGLVHRDIKPANIIVGQRGGVADFVKVLDFGLVKALDDERAKTLTAANAITGTPMYIAPEGIERPADVDARSDLYAVGAVGYFLLTGKQPFDAGNVVELCMKVVQTSPEAPSRRLGKSLAADLEAVIVRCLAKQKADRYQSADELAEALRACTSRAEWSQAEALAWWQSNRPATADASSMPTPKIDADTHTIVLATEKSAAN